MGRCWGRDVLAARLEVAVLVAERLGVRKLSSQRVH